MADALTPETLLADAAWLTRLAVTLAGDADDAEDLVQESWIALWRRAPEADRPLRPWLAHVVRDRSKMRRRSEQRRIARESAAADDREVTPPDALLAQVRLHRLLVDLVLELPEPFRATVIARFVEGQTAAAIARSLGVPESTVRSRLREGLARLRAQLDDKTGERKAWAPAVLAIANRGAYMAKPAKTIAVIVAVLLALIGALAVSAAFDHTRSPSSLGNDRGAYAPSRALGGAVQPDDGDAAITALARGRSPGWLAQEGVAGRRIAGRVLVDGAPASGVLVRLTSEASLAGFIPAREQRTLGDGRFDFGVQVATRYAVGASAPARVATVEPVDLRDPHSRPDDLVIALDPCTVGLFGVVLDPSGSSIAHAELRVEDVIGAESDQSGSFDLCMPAQGRPESIRLVVRASGYGAVELAPDLAGRVHHDITLSPEGVVTGRVVTAQAEPVAHAEVILDWDEAVPRWGTEQPARVRAVTDADGRFQTAGLAAGRRRVIAYARGAAAQPLTVEVGAGESRDIVVTMTERAIVRGTVMLDGKPVAGVTVSNRDDSPTYQARGALAVPATEALSQLDGTFVLDGVAPGQVSLSTSPYRLRAPTTMEVTPGDQRVTLEVEALGALAGTVSRHGVPAPHTLVTAKRRGASAVSVVADRAGRFVLPGLDAGDYALSANNNTIGAFGSVATVRVELGERRTVDLELAYGARIAGTVEDAHGDPVAHGFVRFVDAARDDLGRCTTDAGGRFDCADMTGGGEYRAEVRASEASPSAYPFVGDPPAPVPLADGDSRVDGVRLIVDVHELAISGIVVDSSARPVADARIVVATADNTPQAVPSTITNTAGEFVIDGLSPGAYPLEVTGPDSGKAEVASVAAGTTHLRVVLVAASCDAIDASVGSVDHAEPAGLTHPAGRVVWDDRLELVGWQLPEHVAVGEPFQVTLAYRVLTPIGQSWKIFQHVEGVAARIGADHDPLGGRCPSSTWQPGDVIVDRHTTRIEPSAGAGPYVVWTGFFTGWAQQWKNLAVSDAPADLRDPHDRVKLATIVAE